MKRFCYILSILILILTGSCRTSKKVTPSSPVIVTNTDSVRTEYVETVRIDTVTVEIPLPVESSKQVVQDSTSHLETSLAFSDAWLNPDGTLGHSINNKEQKFKADVPVPVKDTQINNTSASVREVPVPYPEPVYVERDFTRWESFRLGAFWYLVVLSGVSLIFAFRKQLLYIIRKCL